MNNTRFPTASMYDARHLIQGATSVRPRLPLSGIIESSTRSFRQVVFRHDIFPERSAALVAEVVGNLQKNLPFVNLLITPGNTTLGFMEALAAKKTVNWNKVRFIHGAEILGETPDSPLSLASFVNRYFIGLMDPKNRITEIIGPDPIHPSTEAYAARVRKIGGIDIGVLGLAADGEIVFCPQGTLFDNPVSVVKLSREKIISKGLDVKDPTLANCYAMSLGLDFVWAIRHLFMLATTPEKASITRTTLFGPVGPENPASICRIHRKCTFIADELAAGDPASISHQAEKSARVICSCKWPSLDIREKDGEEFIEKMARYLETCVTQKEMELLLLCIKAPVTSLHELDRQLQPAILRYYIEYFDEINKRVSDKGDPKTQRLLLRDLFQRAVTVYKFKTTRAMVSERKALLSLFLFINLRSGHKLGSSLRSDVSLDLLFNEIISSSDPTIFKPALEIAVEFLASGEESHNTIFFQWLTDFLDKSEHLPRFSRALIDLLSRASAGEVVLFEMKDKDVFFSTAKIVVAKIVHRSARLTEEFKQYSAMMTRSMQGTNIPQIIKEVWAEIGRLNGGK
ncbi:MAG: hypothetical protein NTZ10_04350 [Candidatus Saganbacteria bacterium]|nr:hypothetical protein [Candidatus Saganbacteria bacterium]